MADLQMRCPVCQCTDVIQHGLTAQGQPRYRWKNAHCASATLLAEYRHQGRVPAVKQQSLAMTVHGRGSRDLARVLPIRPPTVIDALKNSATDPTAQHAR